jgi:hypothetical protein
MNDLHPNLFAMTRNTASAAATADPLASLVDGLPVEVMGCPQICIQHGSVPKDEVRVGGFDEDRSESVASSFFLPSMMAYTLALFYCRDTVLDCSDCYLCAYLSAMCAILLCCCCCANKMHLPLDSSCFIRLSHFFFLKLLIPFPPISITDYIFECSEYFFIFICLFTRFFFSNIPSCRC